MLPWRGSALSGGLETAAPSYSRLLTAPFLLLIKLYQWTLSPLLHALAGPNAGCRFHPSCSCYAADALRAHGLLRGAALAAWRLLRCNPFTPGGHDPVPPPVVPCFRDSKSHSVNSVHSV